MNEIAETLRERAEDCAFGLELPELEAVVEAQEELLIHIPPIFRDYLLSCSDIIYGHVEPVTIADASSHTHLPELAAELWQLGLPRELIPLCRCGAQVYAVAQDDVVWLWREGEEEAEEFCDDVWHWVRDVWLAGA
ncbi:SMI1/KNR4 family protein [Agaribacterium haliotis]|uniref:SMI1/KNR4 family protein n=1 Tax=Agaribacterium haliotis TaxID=2013869 RepID=UPI000BB56CA4|nr:SMI1/KNR4 family protein [Agaribacterium haliotis]